MLWARQRADFVGREQELDHFRRNLALPATERKYVFAVHGHGGIGKTYLLRQLSDIARESGALAALIDDPRADPVELMSAIAAELEQQGGQARGFTKRYEEYQQRRNEVLNDQQAPSGARKLLGVATMRVLVGSMRTVPGLSLIADAVTPEEVAGWMDQSREFFAQKFSRREDVDLLLSPVDELSKLLVRDLRRLTQHCQVVLLFDNFETIARPAEPWLLDLLAGRFGHLPTGFALVLAGQQPLNPNWWGMYSAVAVTWPLAPFTPEETRELLRRKGITGPETARLILALSGGLPNLVVALADGYQVEGELRDPSAIAVERFMKLEPNPWRRADTLLAALPRRLDEDVLAVLKPGRQSGFFEWLRRLPFVVETYGHLRFQRAVRVPMVRYKSGRSPDEFTDLHRRLFAHYCNRRRRLGLSDQDGWSDDQWRQLLLEETYHRLCADPRQELHRALVVGADACEHGADVVRGWLDVLGEAGRDSGDDALATCARELADAEPGELRARINTRLGSSVEHQEIGGSTGVPVQGSPGTADTGQPRPGDEQDCGRPGQRTGLGSGATAGGGFDPGAGAGGRAGAGAMGAGARPRLGEDEEERERPTYLVEAEDIWLELPKTAPPVLGE
ncbi:hypothetical protein SACE_4521 [Saccharopolyspora erythraea NRRL 2338]|uniref:Uncharacterized protein n=1 Tax=Saccharopolyspora erythraea (strain ATCC 11635 / DSM 40517 / JCM 4748 / NBRC 13426 / NCIMB 8594 / NRRL 2338) TaxID=405948 RepID=A4FIB5_SACEN|nr:hypothetical protein SACE_4521 [Saccharopolyspora erythraea NRRL 2338]